MDNHHHHVYQAANEEYFRRSGRAMLRRFPRNRLLVPDDLERPFSSTEHEVFKAHFGITVEVCVTVWNDLVWFWQEHPPIHDPSLLRFIPMYLLWGLYFLKNYPKERVFATACNVSRVTATKWGFYAISSLFALKGIKIRWDKRNLDTEYHPGLVSKIVVDGTDTRRTLPEPKSDETISKWKSYKFKKSAARWEVATSVLSGDIVWVSGPFPAGRDHDITVFRTSGLKEMLLAEGEKAIADKGYRGEPDVIELPDENGGYLSEEVKAYARLRHETCNSRFKNWAVCGEIFRHSLVFQRECFYAVVVLTQYGIENGESLFEF